MSAIPAKVSQDVVEVLGSWATPAKVSQDVVEVLGALGTYVTWTPLAASAYPIGSPYGDECNTLTPDAKWTATGPTGFTGNGTQYSATFATQRDRIMVSYTDSAGSYLDLMIHIIGVTNSQPMFGVAALDASGNGFSALRYNDGNTYLGNIGGYAYTGNSGSGGGQPTIGDHWLHLHRTPVGLWSARYSSDGSTWSAYFGSASDSRAITQVGLLSASSGVSQTVSMEKVIWSNHGIDTTGFAGGGMVSQDAVEVLVQSVVPVKVSQEVVEVLTAGDGYVPAKGGGGPTSFGSVS